MKTTVINIHHIGRFHRSRYDVYIGRPGPFGNPFEIGPQQSREEVVEKHRQYLKEHPELVERIKKELTGKVLGCFCKPKACHGDTLIKICEGEDW